MKPQALFLGLGLVAGAAGGFAVGQHRRPSAPGPAPATQAETPGATGVTAEAANAAPAEAAPTAAESAAGEDRARIESWLAAGCPMRDWSEIVQLLNHWSDTDPWAAVAFVHGAPRFPERTNALCIPLAAAGRDAPEAVAAWLRDRVPLAARKELATQIVGSLCDQHPAAALALVRAEGIAVEPHTFTYIVGNLVQQDPPAALALFAALPATERVTSAELIASFWSARDPQAAVAWCEHQRGEPHADLAARGVLLALANRDAALAADALLRLQPGAETIGYTVNALTYNDATVALRLAEQLASEARAAAVRALAESALGTAPERIAALAHTALPPADFEPLMVSAWANWRRSDPTAAEAWAERLGDSPTRAAVLRAKLEEVANNEPDLLLASIDAVPAGELERTSIQSALNSLPVATAARWIAERPDLVEPAFAATTAAGYFEADRETATAWALTLPAGTARDHALAATARAWSENGDAAQATATVAAIAEPALRTAARFRVFRSLYERDSAGARTWLAAQPLAPEVRANWEDLAASTATAAPSLHID